MEDELLKHQDSFYILATSSRADDRTRVLKHGETFAVFDRFGDVQPVGLGEQGLYHDGTRFLSRLEVRIGGRRPLLLSSTVKEDNDLLAVDLTNPDLAARDGALVLRRGRAAPLSREVSLARRLLRAAAPVELRARTDGDRSLGVVRRRLRRHLRGARLEARAARADAAAQHRGRHAWCSPTRPRRRRAAHAADVRSAARGSHRGARALRAHAAAARDGDAAADDRVRGGRRRRRARRSPSAPTPASANCRPSCTEVQERQCLIRSPNTQLNHWMKRSLADLQMMITETQAGPYPYAGVPWFSTPFGRDGIITALELLWLEPELARGVLAYLAATQATRRNPRAGRRARQDPARGARRRDGGARRGAVRALLRQRRRDAAVRDAGRRVPASAPAIAPWPRALAATSSGRCDWIDGYGDPDGDGFVEYAAHDRHTGWCSRAGRTRTTRCSTRDGSLAEGPIALCEVQGYVYAARLAARRPGERARHARASREEQRRAPSACARRFESAFWCEELGTYVLALDGRQAAVRGADLERRATASSPASPAASARAGRRRR